jgi:tetratricopeptide (TPR) repeat protein
MALQGLGRIDDAKAELKRDLHLSPQITPMTTRKELWEELGDLAEAENDLTRILEKFGPNTFPLLLRADIRAKRSDFPGVDADRQAALAIKASDPEHQRLVETMWAPFETKFPAYADYLKSLPKSGDATGKSSQTAPDDSWVLHVFDKITSDITQPDIPLTGAALDARKLLVERMRETMTAGDYGQCLNLLERATESVPALSDTPVLSLFRALLLQRLGRDAESEKELDRSCHQETDPRLVGARVSLMDALGKRREAETLVTRMLGEVKPADDALGEQSLPLLDLRANIRAALGDYSGVLADQKEALALIPDEPPAQPGLNLSITRYMRDRKRNWIRENWEKTESRFPGYAAFVKSQSGK